MLLMNPVEDQTSHFATYPSLRNRIVLITGGGSGIGASAVEHFARQGSRVAFFDRALEPSAALVEQLTPLSLHAPVFFPCDLTDISALQQAIADVTAQLGAPQVLINNAGSDDRHLFEEVTLAYWDERMAVNLRHQFFAAQAVAPAMKAAGAGSILNISSISWMIPGENVPVYNTAKAGVVGMTRSLARELGKAGVRVNCVLPGAILTDRQRRLWNTPEYEAEIFASQCLKRNLLPEEVSRLLLFLAADDSSAITNQSYIIDGGWM
ncbi:SDR family NAD(P)-dependent oxidoreductase [Granulicella arctica]|uniref:NAD(P)-dependent dehydrogenase (Short-subunit alcohol dehydrogenase family) n=1 Tax=Granulicella arctica TaxID=940613 RepID=A0A7Y9TFH0_9BACT|nr:SDR family oxidoreductase [Granulicella arctica]NYF78776.1 NAD(P)-dependent dehydrogenase (short-subunit alcohol dehydrogenase family) [Granulicella arctica]